MTAIIYDSIDQSIVQRCVSLEGCGAVSAVDVRVRGTIPIDDGMNSAR